ncbi:hypothetical protein GQX74_012076 [Glossina fuscipes]|nr:hypothetical protein GQX74_012076 [Glossina fuscipes]
MGLQLDGTAVLKKNAADFDGRKTTASFVSVRKEYKNELNNLKQNTAIRNVSILNAILNNYLPLTHVAYAAFSKTTIYFLPTSMVAIILIATSAVFSENRNQPREFFKVQENP